MDAVRIGRVSSVDTAKGMASVVYEDRGGNATPLVPCLACSMPEKGQMVAVLCQRGVPVVVLGAVWNEASPPVPGEDLKGLSARVKALEG